MSRLLFPPKIPALYLHIPFCRRSKCAYCDFYSLPYSSSLADKFIAATRREFSRRCLGRVKAFDSIYLGGGTPTVLSVKQLTGLLSWLKPLLVTGGEFTVEANPESLDSDKLYCLKQGGINRLSLGVQSFEPGKLSVLGRRHNKDDVFACFTKARKAGIKNISLDLIFGVPSETIKIWEKDMRLACSLKPRHISVYCLSFEPGTLLKQALTRGRLPPVGEDLRADMFKAAMDYLPRKGFKQYEISNFCRPGFECRHNMVYWRNQSYLGLGPAAYSFWEGKRSKNVSNVFKYVQSLNKGKLPVSFQEKLSPLGRAKETAAFKIRTMEGINRDWFTRHTGFDFFEIESKVLGLLKNKKLVIIKKTAESTDICLTRKGIMFGDEVSSAFL